jgi:hypothetical protein
MACTDFKGPRCTRCLGKVRDLGKACGWGSDAEGGAALACGRRSARATSRRALTFRRRSLGLPLFDRVYLKISQLKCTK